VSRKAVSSGIRIRLQRQRPVIFALTIGGIGGAVFFVLGLPLPWMLGAMAFSSIAALAGVRIAMPKTLRNTFIPALAVGLGGFFDPSAVANLQALALLALLVLIYLALTCGLGFLYFHRFAGYDRATSCFAAVPGGLTELIILAEPLKADLKVIALVHTARLAVAVPLITFGIRAYYDIEPALGDGGQAVLAWSDVAVLSLCAVIGYLGGRRLRIPAPQMFGPLVLATIAYSFDLVQGVPPGWLIALAQVFVGVFIGARFSGVRLAEIYPVLFWSAGWGCILLALVTLMAIPVAMLLSEQYKTLVLAFAPGGIAEISLLALAAGASLSIVMTVQFLRLAATIILGAIAAPWLVDRSPPHPSMRPDGHHRKPGE